MTGEQMDRSPLTDDVLDAFADIALATRGRVFGLRPGGHASLSHGAGGAHAGLAPLLADPDPRRIDLRATLRDPFGTVWVRRQRQLAEIDVIALVDCSGSMGFHGRASRPELVQHLVTGLAHAASRSSDRFGLVLAGADLREPLCLPPSRRRDLAATVCARIGAATPRGHGVDGMIAARDHLPGRRSVVLLVSDFAWPDRDLHRVLEALSHHDLRPLILGDSALDSPDPRPGLLDLADLETGRRRMVLMRPRLAAAWARAAHARRQRQDRIFAEHGLVPLLIRDQIDTDALFDHLGSHLAPHLGSGGPGS